MFKFQVKSLLHYVLMKKHWLMIGRFHKSTVLGIKPVLTALAPDVTRECCCVLEFYEADRGLP